MPYAGYSLASQLHLLNRLLTFALCAAGGRGLVPATYISLLDEGEGALSTTSSITLHPGVSMHHAADQQAYGNQVRGGRRGEGKACCLISLPCACVQSCVHVCMCMCQWGRGYAYVFGGGVMWLALRLGVGGGKASRCHVTHLAS